MFVGRVIGTVWSTVKWPQVQGLKLLLVRPYHLADLADLADRPGAAGRDSPPAAEAAAAPRPQGGGGPDCEAVVCVDLLDAGVGDDVVVAFGHAARVAAQSAGTGTGTYSGPYQSPAKRSLRDASEGGPATSADRGPAMVPSAIVPSAIVPIDAAIVAIVDRIAVARPST